MKNSELLSPNCSPTSIGVSLFAVGVGEAEYVELREIASQPTDRYILSVNNYASITQIREELLSKICSAAEGLYICNYLLSANCLVKFF